MRRQVSNNQGRQATGQRNISDQERVLNQYCAMSSLERLRLTVRGHYCDEDLTFFLEQAASPGLPRYAPPRLLDRKGRTQPKGPPGLAESRLFSEPRGRGEERRVSRGPLGFIMERRGGFPGDRPRGPAVLRTPRPRPGKDAGLGDIPGRRGKEDAREVLGGRRSKEADRGQIK